MGEARARLHSIDALRGLAALAVVLWHWQNFQLLGCSNLACPRFSDGPDPGQGRYFSGIADHSAEPFFVLFRLFYEQGWIAVDLFFIISGFIFFWTYADRPAGEKSSTLDFAFLRFSRLYPLHIVMLFVVLGLQTAFTSISGHAFVYTANSPLHFAQALFLIQHGGGEAAFNGPEWSITVEIVMYAVFCVLLRFRLLRYAIAPAALFGLGLVLYDQHGDLARGLCGFFAGGLTFRLFDAIRRRERAKRYAVLAIALALIGWALVLVDVYGEKRISGEILKIFNVLSYENLCSILIYGLFPITIIAVLLHEDLFKFSYEPVSWLGEISYASYLLHFPLQLIFAIVVVEKIVTPAAIGSAPSLVVFMALLIGLSLLVFRKFEAPAQRALRALWARRGVGRPG